MLLQMLTALKGWGQQVWASLWCLPGAPARLHKHSLAPEFAAPAQAHTGFSLQTPDPHSTSILVPISQKFLILISISATNMTPHKIHLVCSFPSIPPSTLSSLLSNSNYNCTPSGIPFYPTPCKLSLFLHCAALGWSISIESSLKNLSKTTVLSQAKSYRAGPVLRIPVFRDGRLFTKYLQTDLLGVEVTDLWGWHPVMQLTSLSDTKHPFQSTEILGVSANIGKVSSSTIWSTIYKLHWLIISKTLPEMGKGKKK